MADEVLTCRTFDEHGDSICDRPARFIVWGHLYPKDAKGPKCGYHTPRGALLPTGFGAPAIYEIPAQPACSMTGGVCLGKVRVIEDPDFVMEPED